MELPKDNSILLSFLNMKLRDEYGTLDELCDELEFDREALEARLRVLGYEYDAEQNRIR